MLTLIKNAKVITPDFDGFCEKDVYVDGDRIVESQGKNPDKIIDANGKYLLPGLIDLHIHGGIMANFSSTENPLPALEFNVRKGVTSVLATMGVNKFENLLEYAKNIAYYVKNPTSGANIVGIHFEGPFLSNEKKGAMHSPDIDATIENFQKLVEAGEGCVRLMTIAPERENALEIIKEGKKRGIRMSIGHTMATYEQAMAAVEAGATGATHTFNAMRSLLHRDPGVLGAVLTEPSVSCEVICDFVHLSPAIVKLIYASKGEDGMILISDSGPQTGMPDGQYVFSGKLKTNKNGVCTIDDGKTISGSLMTMGDSAKNLISIGIPLNVISKMGSRNPAKAIGVYDEVGSIEAGKRADIIIVDEFFNLDTVIVRGEEVEM